MKVHVLSSFFYNVFELWLFPRPHQEYFQCKFFSVNCLDPVGVRLSFSLNNIFALYSSKIFLRIEHFSSPSKTEGLYAVVFYFYFVFIKIHNYFYA